jgi:hypothetical protein
MQKFIIQDHTFFLTEEAHKGVSFLMRYRKSPQGCKVFNKVDHTYPTTSI